MCWLCGQTFSADCVACNMPNQQESPPKVVGVANCHVLEWGDSVASYLRCKKCGVGFSRNAKMIDLLKECGKAAIV